MIEILLGLKGTLLRGALATVLAYEDDLRVVGEAASAPEVLAVARREQPDVLVLDADLPGGVEIGELCRRVCADLPRVGLVVMLDRRACVGVGRTLLRLSGRVGLIGMDASPARLIEAVHRTARGEPVLDVELAMAALTARESPLTDRESEILRKAMSGAPARHIAAELFLSARTVQNSLSRIVAKTGARTRIEAIRIAQEAGWI